MKYSLPSFTRNAFNWCCVSLVFRNHICQEKRERRDENQRPVTHAPTNFVYSHIHRFLLLLWHLPVRLLGSFVCSFKNRWVENTILGPIYLKSIYTISIIHTNMIMKSIFRELHGNEVNATPAEKQEASDVELKRCSTSSLIHSSGSRIRLFRKSTRKFPIELPWQACQGFPTELLTANDIPVDVISPISLR